MREPGHHGGHKVITPGLMRRPGINEPISSIKDGYATDLGHSVKLTAIICAHKLDQYDNSQADR